MSEHLLVVTTNYSHTSGGVEGHLAALLPLLVQRGVRVTLLHLAADSAITDERGVRVWALRRRLDFRRILALPGPLDLLRAVRSMRKWQEGPAPVTVIATHTRFFPMTLIGVALGRLLRVPVVHTEHGGGHVATSSRVVDLVSRLVDITIGRLVLRSATRVLAVSRDGQRFVRELAGVEARLFHNGVDLARWVSEGAVPPDLRNLVFVGRLVHEKGWRTFLAVAAECELRGWKGEALVCGDGPDRALVGRTAEALGVTRARVLGSVPPETVRNAFHGGVYLNPTTAAEGFQLTLIEAAAAGASIVTYAVGGTDELADLPGTDIVIIAKGDEKGLAEATWAALNRRPPSPELSALSAWDWTSVANEYVSVLRSV